MKNTLKIMLFVAFATLTFTSCNKENTPAIQEDTVLDITMDYANFSGNDTKGTKTTWENGDLVYMIFRQDGATEYDFKNYVKMQFNGTKWVVANKPEGQTVLNNLPVGKGLVSACHHTGITDPSLSTGGTGIEFPNDNRSCFALWTPISLEYAKTPEKITAALKFKPKDTFQFNIKGLDFEGGKYALNIYDGSKDGLTTSFGQFLLHKYGVKSYAGPGNNIPAQKGIDTKEISFFVKFVESKFAETKKSINANRTFNFKFNPTFKLGIKIGSTTYYAERTITGKTYTEYNAYFLKGPNKTDAEIQAAKSGADLGNGWTKK